MADIRPFCMPKWGIEMTEGVLADWKIEQGAAFKRGDVLCDIETDKITNEVEAEYDAVARRILVAAGGDPCPVGTLLAVFADAAVSDAEIEAFVAGFRPAETAVAAKAAEEAPGPPAKTAPGPVKITTNRPISSKALELAEQEGADLAAIQGSGRDGRITYQDVHQALRAPASPTLRGGAELPEEVAVIFASPLARRIAAIHGIDLAGIDGTGPRGRISKADVLALVSAPPAGVERGPFALVDNRAVVRPFEKFQAVAARRLTEAKQTIPHFYLRTSVAVDELLALRRTANLVLGTQASLNDYLVRAVALALSKHPAINVQLHGDKIHSFPYADIAIAVAGPKGLVTPIVRQADRMRIETLAETTRALIDKARAGKLAWDDVDGGTFTVSNLGMFGIESFDAIINPPQAAILAVGAATRQPLELGEDGIGFESRISLTLSVDHRAIDGAAGAEFLATLKQLIEAPKRLFA